MACSARIWKHGAEAEESAGRAIDTDKRDESATGAIERHRGTNETIKDNNPPRVAGSRFEAGAMAESQIWEVVVTITAVVVKMRHSVCVTLKANANNYSGVHH